MFSTLTRSVRKKFQPELSSPVLSARTITFPRDDFRPSRSSKRSLYYHDNGRRESPRYADHDEEEGSERGGVQDSVEEEESSSNDGEEAPLLPIFSSDHLNALPVFTLTHTFRDMVVERCDTVLTWDQLRSPQVSQFLVKPIEHEIRENHLNAATHSALLANALQFTKEAGSNPGNSGTNKTRAMICELIAIKMLREFDTRGLIDALSYDFNPMQGQPTTDSQPAAVMHRRPSSKAVRISCIEIAIRATAKRFLAHPLVVQHLEAIWNGSIVFHSAADSMHRRRPSVIQNSYGTHGRTFTASPQSPPNNRIATLYNPREASLFKLSRLRVPRYRNVLSTVSFAILLLLFMAVLEDKSLYITPLEIVFWIWAAGYMLEEVIGFNEQGFSLYLASFWNTFDIGILLLLFVHLCLRLYGIVLPDGNESKRYVAKLSYDILATSSVLLFPRLFSILDHYRYFSQLIIAFRIMAKDMLAIFLLIVIFCSGFLVALTFAFSAGSQTDDPKEVAYALLQMLLGFTPAAWDRWDDYNWLGRTVLILFLFVCHFVVVTILITVMTNSFMEIVRNANDEHQFLFAVNVISSVKSDALFAYVPPINVLQWLITPLRYVIPFREYLKVNRTIIKITHLPILWTIYFYERFVLQSKYIDTIDLVESRGRQRKTFTGRLPRLMREPSIATFRQEAALEEVFKSTTMRTNRSQDRGKSTTAVNNWMNTVDDEEPPQEQDRKVVDKLEKRRFGSRRRLPSHTGNLSVSRRPTSIASDPHDFTSLADFLSPRGRIPQPIDTTPSAIDLPSQQTDADGDDELMTNEHEDDRETNVISSDLRPSPFTGLDRDPSQRDYFTTRTTTLVQSPFHDSADSANPQKASRQDPRPRHNRNVSSATMIFNPPSESENERPLPFDKTERSPTQRTFDAAVAESNSPSSKLSSHPSSRKTPKRLPPRLRPSLPTKDNAAFRSVPNVTNLLDRSKPPNIQSRAVGRPRRSSLEMDLVSDIGDNKAIGGGYVGAIPASFASHMVQAVNPARQSQLQLRKQEEDRRRHEDSEMFGRLMMARMNTLEEGFREVVHEVREGMRQVGSGLASRQRSPDREGSGNVQVQRKSTKKFKERQERTALASGSASINSTEKEPILPRTPRSGAGSVTGKEQEPEETVQSGGAVQAPLSTSGDKSASDAGKETQSDESRFTESPVTEVGVGEARGATHKEGEE